MKAYLLAALALIASSVDAPAVSAFTLQPPMTTAHLKGTLLFQASAQTGGGTYRCKVNLMLKTRKQKGVSQHVAQFISGTITNGTANCPSFVQFIATTYPANVMAGSATIAGTSLGTWGEAGTPRCEVGATEFTVDDGGLWTTMAGGCFSGALRSIPPITIGP